MDYIERIKNLREDNDMSQKQVAEKLSISQRCYSHYEAGSRKLPVDILISLADLYHCSVDYILGRTDKKTL